MEHDIKVLNVYAQICHELPKLNDPFYVFKEENKEPAERLLGLIDEFNTYVPEGVRKNLIINPDKIKKRCIDVLAELKELNIS